MAGGPSDQEKNEKEYTMGSSSDKDKGTVQKREAKISACLKPSPSVLVSCRGLNGEDNALAAGYWCNCSYDPPMVMVGITPSRYSHQMIKESGCFVVNLVSDSFRETFDYLGSHSRRDKDKLARMGVKL